MSDIQSAATPVFDFMVVRAPEPVAQPSMHRHYIRDGAFLVQPPLTHVPPPPTIENYSTIGRLVFEHVFRDPPPEDRMGDLLTAILELVGGGTIRPDDTEPEDTEPDDGDIPDEEEHLSALTLRHIDTHTTILRDGVYYVLPDRLDEIDLPLMPGVLQVLAYLRRTGVTEPAPVLAAVQAGFGQELADVVFGPAGGHHADFIATVRGLFEVLYVLYVLRRWTAADLGGIFDGLRVLHLLEALAIDAVYARVRASEEPEQRDAMTIGLLATYYPELGTWDGTSELSGFPLVATEADVAAYFGARPVIHPIFAKLFGYRTPFNDLAPLGIGDFKVVKQWLVGYDPGEICDIHNIMKGETKERVHRRLEKTDEVFSFSSSSEQETTRDTQSTDRFELKREAEATLKTDLNVNANANVQYKGTAVVASIGGGFAYNRSDSSVQKMAQNFSREVVAKAVSRVETKLAQQRTVTKVFETEETNKHTLASPTEHVSGIYRWLDKRYKAQVFNFGKRMMFEFVLPEPAAFLVESRLRAFEAELDVPQPPREPAYATVHLGFTAAEITPELFNVLRQDYDLGSMTYPHRQRRLALINPETNTAFFSEKDIESDDIWWSKTYTCKVDAPGYEVVRLRLNGSLFWRDATPENEEPRWRDRNFFSVALDGATVAQEDHSHTAYVAKYTPNDDLDLSNGPLGKPYVLNGESLNLILGFQEITRYHLEIAADLELSPDALLAWQTSVYKTVLAQAQHRVDEINRELRLGYDSAMSTYRNRIGELDATVVNDLLQGTSESANEDMIRTDLRRQCLAMITKELTSSAADDMLTTWDATSERSINRRVTRFAIDEDLAAGHTEVSWVSTDNNPTEYPVVDMDMTRRKGRYVQFLEQAFDWDNLAWMCLPYFWATPPRWIELMARQDLTDPQLTAFLRAGAVRVLLAVTPAYDDAVLHFLATREPWDGGVTPVIGSPLYLPLHEELRAQQDDLYGAEPEGEAWEFTVPTSLVYLHGSDTEIPDISAERRAREEEASEREDPTP